VIVYSVLIVGSVLAIVAFRDVDQWLERRQQGQVRASGEGGSEPEWESCPSKAVAICT